MAFLSKKTVGDQRWDGETACDAPRSSSFNPERIIRWVAVPSVGAAVGLWLVGTMAGLSSVGASLSATSGGLPQTLSIPGSLALADPLKQRFLTSSAPFVLANAHGGARALRDHAVQCGAGCFKLAGVSPQTEKSARLVAQAKPVPMVVKSKSQERFERMEASLSPTRLAAAFAGAGKPAGAVNASAHPVISAVAPQITEASLVPSVTVMASLSDDMPAPAAERFARMDTGSVVQTAPQPMGFAQSDAEAPDNAQLALALVQSLPVDDVAFASPLPIEESSADIAVSPVEIQQEQPGDAASLPDALTDDVPLPTQRPQFDAPQPPKVVQQSTKPVQQQPRPAQQPKPARETIQQAQPAKPARRGRPADGGDVLAYAKPDTPSGGLGQAFRNLFNSPGSRSGAGNGVAIYDISAKTVYMPDGQRLEAHSGLGAMVDQPRYVDQKDRGPTPPNTYNLSLRESRFHGVEALRLTPVNGGNKYNRNGLLAHTYMLRGGRAESNGCVVFRDYARFLAAFKRGKVARLVVVPRLNGSPTRVASAARGA
ncbi:tlde1 domain-containing protein [Mesorhizobium calcicola]|uniref:Tlde1 domain-containing protein n=1 Tax=Mesorhizobium calcicola TaxID=1300310 RepID=A0ABW4WBD9_9HYPH